jgi:hypothetical protein
VVKEQKSTDNIIQLIQYEFPAFIGKVEIVLDETTVILNKDVVSGFLTLCQFLHDQP